ncbi:hypothetical protein [Amycolatopsis sp. lyj-112]|uniref:hypothetical protein n=1 Tax=Amycolatopsis sp. lyj-112 TaxID=2789288 RepID=UPI00397B6671
MNYTIPSVSGRSRVVDFLRELPGFGDERADEWRGRGRRPGLTDSELITMAVAQMLQRYDNERRWIRHIHADAGWRDVSGRAEPVRLSQAVEDRATVTAQGDSHTGRVPSWFDDLWILGQMSSSDGRPDCDGRGSKDIGTVHRASVGPNRLSPLRFPPGSGVRVLPGG